jgi:hypothetical protein
MKTRKTDDLSKFKLAVGVKEDDSEIIKQAGTPRRKLKNTKRSLVVTFALRPQGSPENAEEIEKAVPVLFKYAFVITDKPT